MKKKIKDLTLVEAGKICCSSDCDNCPLNFDKENRWCGTDFSGMDLEKTFKKELEKEIGSQDTTMKKKIYVFIGDPETGKSTLARLCSNSYTKILDDICPIPASIKSLVNHIEKGSVDFESSIGYIKYETYILICHPKTSNILLDALKEAPND